MFTHTVVKTFQSESSLSFRGVVISQGGLEVNIDEAIPAESADLQVAFAVDVSQLQSLFMLSDKAMSLKTNSDSAPANTIELEANVPFLWTSQNGLPLTDTVPAAISTDITKLYVSSTEAAALKIRALLDPTV